MVTMPTPADTPLLLDVMLGKLARYLRMCGYDTVYALDRGIEADPRLRELSGEEGRVLLTRDTDLARRTDGAIRLRTRMIDAQLAELADAGFELTLSEPRRCSLCNGRLRRVGANEELPSFAPRPTERPVWRCRECDQPFWRGSHWDDVASRLDAIER